MSRDADPAGFGRPINLHLTYSFQNKPPFVPIGKFYTKTEIKYLRNTYISNIELILNLFNITSLYYKITKNCHAFPKILYISLSLKFLHLSLA